MDDRVDEVVDPLVRTGAGPWLVRWRGAYHYCPVGPGGAIRTSRAPALAAIGRVAPQEVVRAQPATSAPDGAPSFARPVAPGVPVG